MATNGRATKIDRKPLLRALGHVIMDGKVAQAISAKWDGKPVFGQSWCNKILSWGADHFKNYGEAMREQGFATRFEDWADKAKNKDDVELMQSFSQYLSDIYSQTANTNSDYALDQVLAELRRAKLTSLEKSIRASLEAGNLDKAEGDVVSYARIQVGEEGCEDPFTDEEDIEDTYAGSAKPLIRYPGSLGVFLQDVLTRDAFVAFEAPEKTGKSFVLLDLAYRAMRQRKKVIFFAIGDMSKRQVKLRLMSRNAKHPFKSPNNIWPYTFDYPELLKKGRRDTMDVDAKKLTFNSPMDKELAKAACKKVMQHKVKSRDSYFKLCVRPNFSMNVLDIEGVLQSLELGGWIPDVVVIDYADLFSPLPGKELTPRDLTNRSWMMLRGLADKRHCLVVTATQGKASAYKKARLRKATLNREDYSEDKRKNAHATAIIGLNVTDEEKEKGLCRWNFVVAREIGFVSSKVVHVAGCLPLCNPCVLSSF